MKIQSISSLDTGFNQNGTPNITIFGLGDDDRVYMWSFEAGQWVPNWKPPQPIAGPRKPSSRRAAGKKKR